MILTIFYIPFYSPTGPRHSPTDEGLAIRAGLSLTSQPSTHYSPKYIAIVARASAASGAPQRACIDARRRTPRVLQHGCLTYSAWGSGEGSSGTGVTHGFRDRAPVQDRLPERHPSVQRLHPRALMHATILQACGRGDEQCREHLEAPQSGGGTTRRGRPRFGHAARGTAGSDTGGARGEYHTVGNASGKRRACLASRGGLRGWAQARGRPLSMIR